MAHHVLDVVACTATTAVKYGQSKAAVFLSSRDSANSQVERHPLAGKLAARGSLRRCGKLCRSNLGKVNGKLQ